MKTNNNKSSVRKKLVPAVAMLTASAVMLSTATYAWFTMNKEVEVTGLQMSATTSQSLEVSLGTVDASGNLTIAAPGINDVTWAHAISVGEYYNTVGKLKPSSTDTAFNMYKVDETKIKAGGRLVDNDAVITTLATIPSNQNGPATLLADANITNDGLTTSNDTSNDGYYIDIPMWLRSSELKSHEVKCTVTITDPDDTNGSDLIEAVRVAIVPIGTSETSAGINNITGGATTTVGGQIDLASASKSFIFARPFSADTEHATQHYNENKVVGGTITSGTTSFSAALAAAPTLNEAATTLKDTNVNGVDDGNKHANDTPETVVFTLPGATKDDYATQAFVARIWIEGQSTYCNDATANQDWQIDFHFELGDEVVTP